MPDGQWEDLERGGFKLLDHLVSEVAIQKVSPRVVHDHRGSRKVLPGPVWHKTCGQSGALFNE